MYFASPIALEKKSCRLLLYQLSPLGGSVFVYRSETEFQCLSIKSNVTPNDCFIYIHINIILTKMGKTDISAFFIQIV